jgi:ribosomal protein S18 acetylase RimI-like enzyme
VVGRPLICSQAPDLMAKLNIRSFEPYDQAAVWRLHNSALTDAGVHGGNGPWDDDLRDPAVSYLARGGEFVVGFVSDQLVAMGALLPTSQDAAEVKRMRIHPRLQRQGFGSRILWELERRARHRGIKRLHLDTTTLQLAAQRFYEHHGYSEVRRGSLGPFVFIDYEKSLQ